MNAGRKGIHNNGGADSSRNYYPQNIINKTNGATDVRISTIDSSDIVWTNKVPKGVFPCSG
ncbi:unnamed protein product [Prunus armeniaca]|uniref:Uncharacterized protein n=1 Tax=Prunus armeniaca TaxID=36596 RepID=A0A6J5TG70_PRUAR|nr:unnamed protein product [Prunus armeniaca]